MARLLKKALCTRVYYPVVHVYRKEYLRPFFRHFFTSTKTESIHWEGSQTVLLRNLEVALKDHQVDEAWEAYNDFRKLHGFPNHSLTSRLIIELSYSSDPQLLQRACDLVFLLLKEKSGLVRSDLLTKLSLSLARAEMPVPASMIFRLMLERESLPPLSILRLLFLHMVKTEIGTYLASNILFALCDSFRHPSATRSASAKLIKPDTVIFNLVLDACVRFGSSFKGQQIIELMAQAGVVADAHSIIIISRIHEMNGQRDELKKFKDHIDQVSVLLIHHFKLFYDRLLSLHFKFNDVDAASGLVLDLYRCNESPHSRKDRKDLQKPCLVPIGSHNLRAGVKIQILPELLQKDSVLKMETKEELVMYKNGKVGLSNKGIAKLIIQHKRCGMISELSKLLISIQKTKSSNEESLCSDVVDACINLGWLETAHDILDDMELAGSMGTSSYTSLLQAYYRREMFREAEALLKQIRKAGLVVKMSDEEDKTTLSSKRSSSGKSGLAESLIREMEEAEKAEPSMIYEFNSSIYFFWKAKMVGDALNTYRKMQQMKIEPTVQTFLNMVSGYSSLEMYRDITILWGDIKRNMEKGNLVVNRDLYETLILNFLRGGYFERVLEVIGCMEKGGMYIDKWMFKFEFLKFHKDLYRSLKASNAKTETQSKRIEHVREFRQWVGIH
ncbi:pentatricopeptide repeat (PPR) superfamily protein [Actinidia rufa]|uniref:Pentatricopeptide repeat (PPR) superfamily protein n=1 Tax=Actinidia rufa TaxID=165716 RepID=A0A7J0FQ54_9ERIC|nr:pentatricopeptide repeat (PPR) superfamily protein [Actinidia rufa]